MTRPPTPSDRGQRVRAPHGSRHRRRSRRGHAAARLGQRANEEVEALRGRQPRDGEDVVAVLRRTGRRAAAAAATARRRGRRGRRAAGAGSCATARRLRVARCAAATSRPARISDFADAFLHACPRRNRRRKPRPQVVVLAHRVIEPAHVRRMPDRVARIAEAEIDLVDARRRSATSSPRYVGERPAEPEVGRDDEMRVVALLAGGRDERAGDDEMSAFNARRTGGDDGEDGHRQVRWRARTRRGPARRPRRRGPARRRARPRRRRSTAWLPIVTPSRIFAPAPSQAPSPMVTPDEVRA